MGKFRRIIPVSSGKGGVGKTTFAINFALGLSRHAPTLLVDLDTGTSSVRNNFEVPIKYDLYHFFRQGRTLSECITRLPPRLDPKGEFRNFGFVAGPRHMIDEITNMSERRRIELTAAVNALEATYIVLDLRAGFDANVLDFLPISNTGILVMTPHLPSATMAASDMAKAILFRKLRLIFAPDSPFYATVADGHGRVSHYCRLVNELIDRVEDVYDDSIKDLDAFVLDLHDALGDHPIVNRVADTIEHFRVWIVLNMFNEVEDSYKQVIAPFIANVTENLSARIRIFNLGWIVQDPAIHASNLSRRPALLRPAQAPVDASMRRVQAELESLERLSLGLTATTSPQRVPKRGRKARGDQALTEQLDILRSMYVDQQHADYRQNFHYIVSRVRHALGNRRVSELGDERIWRPQELLSQIFPGAPAHLTERS